MQEKNFDWINVTAFFTNSIAAIFNVIFYLTTILPTQGSNAVTRIIGIFVLSIYGISMLAFTTFAIWKEWKKAQLQFKATKLA